MFDVGDEVVCIDDGKPSVPARPYDGRTPGEKLRSAMAYVLAFWLLGFAIFFTLSGGYGGEPFEFLAILIGMGVFMILFAGVLVGVGLLFVKFFNPTGGRGA